MVNHEGYDRRMDVVRAILGGFGLQAADITTIEYVEHCPFPFNNFIYKATLTTPANTSTFYKSQNHQPYTVCPPEEGVTSLVIRLSNPRALGLNNANRVQNEVAAMHIARRAMDGIQGGEYAGIVPALYAWRAADPVAEGEAGFGWLIMQFMEGEPLDAHFDGLRNKLKAQAKANDSSTPSINTAQKQSDDIIAQVADIFTALQTAQIPPDVGFHGGFNIDAAVSGAIINGQSTLVDGGPWSSYSGLISTFMKQQLRDADSSDVIRGWRDNGVRQRIDGFLEGGGGLTGLLEAAGVDQGRLALVHGDFTMNNMLVDPSTNRITALLDFDWSSVTHPGHEFFASLHDVHGGTNLRHGIPALQAAILSGDFSSAPSPPAAAATVAEADVSNAETNPAEDEEEEEKKKKKKKEDKEEQDREAWALASAWDRALRERGATRPSDIRGMSTMQVLSDFAEALAPFHLATPAMLKRKTPEQIAEQRAEGEAAILKQLDAWRF